MVNLLPVETKKDLKKNYHWRRRLVALVFGVSLVSISLVLSATIYIILFFQEKSLTTNEQKHQNQVADARSYDQLAQSLKTVNNLSFQMARVKTDDALLSSALLVRLIALKGQGIKIKDLQLKITGEGKQESVDFALKGSSQSRQAFTDFLTALKSSSQFAQVNSPLTNLINEGTSDFSLDIIIGTSTAKASL